MAESEVNSPSLHLEEVWKQRGSEDKLSAPAMLLHHSRLAVVFLTKSALTSVLAICSVATVLFILGFLIAMQKASIFGLNSAAGQLQMSVFVRDNCSNADWDKLDKFIKALPGIANQRKLDKSAALAELKKSLSGSPDLLNGLEQDNPLPASYELSFNVSESEKLSDYASQIKAQAGVESVSYDGQLVRVLSDLGSKLKGAGRFSTIILIGITLFLIATTIRISLYHESDEIEIMGLVGAYHSFIQAPFIIGGALQGLLGFVIAIFSLSLVESRILGTLRSEELLKNAGINFSLLGFQNIFFLAALGIGAGVVGSYFASRRVR